MATVQDAEHEEVLDEQPRSLVFHLVKQLTAGQDLTRVLIPTFFLEPRSLLEKFSDLMAHPQLILGTAEIDDPLERMLAITRWYISGWHVRPKNCKKPYNPLLGEEFHCYWEHPDGTTTLYVAEQVSHHPPVSGIYLENRPHNITLNAQVWTKSKFLGNSAASINVGECHVHLCNRGEVYSFTFPTAYACGLFIGKLRMELGGKIEIKCPQSGFVCELEFITKPMIGGDYNCITGQIKMKDKVFYTLSGKWDEKVIIKDGRGKEEVFFDANETPVLKKFVRRLEDQGPWESRKAWIEVTKALKMNPADHDLATKHKTALEDAQRERRKEHEAKGTHHVPKYFVLDKHQRWVYKKINTKPYDESEKAVHHDDLKDVEEDDDSGLPPGAKVKIEDVHHTANKLANTHIAPAPAAAAAAPEPEPAQKGPVTANILGL